MSNFDQFNLPSALVESLKDMKITSPTAIQKAAIPPALEGRDILASAQTGSGKTIAFSIPLIMKLLNHPNHTALIVTPTRELAAQVDLCLRKLSPQSKTALLIGGAPMFKQMNALRKKPQIIVGTPGRITDHLMRGSLNLKDTHFLVVDEADRMLDMGFGIQLDKIAEFLPTNRQTLMFSATFPPNIHRLSKKYLTNPENIIIKSTESTPKIKQEVIKTTNGEKFSVLLDQLIKREGSVLIFTKTKRGADRLSKDLKSYGHTVNAIHGDLSQQRRDRVIRSFRNNENRILVATDIASRGLDIPHIQHVINYELPQCPEDYVHRIGRTGRAGAEGNALCLIAPSDGMKWKEICKVLNPKHSDEKKSSGFSHNRSEKHAEHPSEKRPFKQKKRPFRKYRRKQSHI